MPKAIPPLKILSIVEATTINAVAKSVLEFHRTAREHAREFTDFPAIEGSIVTFERRGADSGSPNPFLAVARELGLDVDVIPERRRFDLSVIPALRNVVDNRGPGIVVTHSVKSHFVLWRSRIWQAYPWVAFHHGYTITDLKMRVYNRVDSWSLPKADRLVTVCHAFVQELVGAGVPLESIAVQHNSIRPQQRASEADVAALKNRLGIADDERVLLAVGRLSREKAHIDLVEAFKRLRDTNPQLKCKLVIVGDGPERARLETAAELSGCKDLIIFAGQVSDVQSFYAASDVLVLPSHSEGSPYVLLEAMAAELPIVATMVGGVPEMVENNESALLVAANDPSSMAAAILRILTDKEMAHRLAANASALVTTQYSPEKYVRSLFGLYREVIDRRTSTTATNQKVALK